MEKNKYVIELIIDTKNDNPDIVTKGIGIQPSKIIRKGESFLRSTDKFPIPGKVNENNLWIYSVVKIYDKEGLYLNNAVSEFLQNFNECQTQLKNLLKSYPSNRMNCIAYFKEHNPFFQFDNNLIEQLNYYSLKLTFDVYFVGDE